jgi:hypothetical protein
MILYTAKIIKELLKDTLLKSGGFKIKIITLFVVKFILLLSFLKTTTLDNSFVIDASAQTSSLPSCLEITNPSFTQEQYPCQLFLHGVMDNGLIYSGSSKILSTTNQTILLDLKNNDYYNKSIDAVASSFANKKESGLTLTSCIAFRNENPSLNAMPRINCLDLADLPLCNDNGKINPIEKLEFKNCVNECSKANNNVDDYIKNHNKSCVAFLDTAVSILKNTVCANINPIDNCADYKRIIEKTNRFTRRKCQQLAQGVAAQEGVNCDKIQCNLLTPGEIISYQRKECLLSESNSSPPSSSAKGCEFSKVCNTKDVNKLHNKILCEVIPDKKSVEYASCLSKQFNLKCYQFSSGQLYASAFGYYANTCELHNCDSNSVGVTTTSSWLDSENVIAKNTNYIKNYYKNIAGSQVSIVENIGTKDSSTGIIAKLKFVDVTDPDSQIAACSPNPGIHNITYDCTNSVPKECNTECKNNECSAIIDCSSPSNINNSLCFESDNKVLQEEYFDDRHSGEPYLNSSFHRPVPKNEAYCNAVSASNIDTCTNLETCKNVSGGAFAFRFNSKDSNCSGVIKTDFQFECLDPKKDIDMKTNPSSPDASYCTNLSPKDYLGRVKDSNSKCCKPGSLVQHKKIDIYHDGYIPGEDIFWNTSDLYSPKVKNKQCSGSFHDRNFSNISPLGGLCGHNGSLLGSPSDDIAYFEGYPRAFYEDGKLKYRVRLCVRRSSLARPRTCGSRYCKTYCTVKKGWPAQICTQYCGYEECKELIVDNSNKEECKPTDDLMRSREVDEKCVAVFRHRRAASGYRVRATRLGNQICAILDYTGVPGYSTIDYLSRDEKVDLTIRQKKLLCDFTEGAINNETATKCVKDKALCVTGSLNTTDYRCVGGYDSRNRRAIIYDWRQKHLIPFSSSNGATKIEDGIQLKGFYDSVGRFHEERRCAPVPSRKSPPKMYNLANIDNSYRIFDIPLFASLLNGSEASFHNPKIKVTYGFSEFVLQLSSYVQQGVSLPITDPKTDQSGAFSSSDLLNNVLDSLEEMTIANKDCNDYKNAFVKKYNALNYNGKVAKSCDSTDFDKYLKFNLGLYLNPDGTSDSNKITYSNSYEKILANDPQISELLRFDQGLLPSYSDIKDTDAISKTLFKISNTNKTLPIFTNASSDTIPKEILLKTITVGGVAIGGNNPRTATLFLKKEYNGRPEICLMRRFLNKNNNHQDIKVKCFPRKISDFQLITYEKTSNVPGVNLDDDTYGQGEYKVENGNIKEVTPTIYGHKKIFFRFFDPNTKSYSSEYYLNNINHNSNNCGFVKTNTDTGVTDLDLINSFSNEKQRICSERSECSRFFNECTANTIQNHRKNQLGIVVFNDPEDSSCQYLQKLCLSKYGLSEYENIFDIVYNKYRTTVPSELKSNVNYGFFNEICLTARSVEHLLKENVVAYDVDSSIGKCITQESTDKCRAYGGNGRDCNCLKLSLPLSSEDHKKYNILEGKTLISREPTPREAGFCVDIPIPPYCPAVNYLDFNLDKTNLLFNFPASSIAFNANGNPQIDRSNSLLGPVLSDSVLISGTAQLNGSRLIKYGTDELIDIEHYNRNFDKDEETKSKYEAYNHANFPIAFPGMAGVKGSCQGYWKNELINGKLISPVANCVIQDRSEFGKWENVTNRCIRKTCQAVDIPANAGVSYNKQNYYIVNKEAYNGLFQLGYGSSYSIAISELGANNDESKGASNGFATWRKVDVMDFDFNVEATACIPGYKEVGSQSNQKYKDNPKNFPDVDSKFMKMVDSYTDGQNPVRICSPHSSANEGFWKNDHFIGENYGRARISQHFGINISSDYAIYRGNSIKNQCLRIYCPLLSSDKMEDLRYLRGAEFKGKEGLSNKELSYPASKATDPSYYEKYYGECREDKGFYKNGTASPYRTCDNFGNWGPVINPCLTKCDAVNDENARNGNNGNATWSEGKTEPGFDKLVNGTCVAGFVVYPYSPPKIFTKCIHSSTTNSNTNLIFKCYKIHSQGNTYGDMMLKVEQSSSTINVDVSNDLVEKEGYEISVNSPEESIPSGLLFSNVENSLVDNSSSNGYIKTGIYTSKPMRACASVKVTKSNGSFDYITRWVAPLSSCINRCPGGTLMPYDTSNPQVVIDSRINAGITPHYSNLLKKTIYIKWPTVKFGSRVVLHGNVNINTNENGRIYLSPTAYSPEEDFSNNLDFTKYEKDLRGKNEYNTGSYVISRSCGYNGRWAEPVVGCGTSDSDSKYFTMSDYSNNKVSLNASSILPIASHEFIKDLDTKSDGDTDSTPQNYIIGQKSYNQDSIKVELGGACNANNNYYPKTDYTYGTAESSTGNHIVNISETFPKFYCKTAEPVSSGVLDVSTHSVIDGSYFDFVNAENKCQVYCSFESQSTQLFANMNNANVVINPDLASNLLNQNRRFLPGSKTNSSNIPDSNGIYYSDGRYASDTLRLFKCASGYTSAELSSPSKSIADQFSPGVYNSTDYVLKNNADVLCGNTSLTMQSTRQFSSPSVFNAKIPYAVCGADGNFDFNQGQKCDQQCLGCALDSFSKTQFIASNNDWCGAGDIAMDFTAYGIAKLLKKTETVHQIDVTKSGYTIAGCTYAAGRDRACAGRELYVRADYVLSCFDGKSFSTITDATAGTCSHPGHLSDLIIGADDYVKTNCSNPSNGCFYGVDRNNMIDYSWDDDTMSPYQ